MMLFAALRLHFPEFHHSQQAWRAASTTEKHLRQEGTAQEMRIPDGCDVGGMLPPTANDLKTASLPRRFRSWRFINEQVERFPPECADDADARRGTSFTELLFT